MRFCNCGKLLGNLLLCLPDMVLYDCESMIRKSDSKLKEMFKTAWPRCRLPFNFSFTRVRHFLCWQSVTSPLVNFHCGSRCVLFDLAVVDLGLFYDFFLKKIAFSAIFPLCVFTSLSDEDPLNVILAFENEPGKGK